MTFFHRTGLVHDGAYRMVFSDGGRKESRRPRQGNDCTVRAIVEATWSDYDEVYDLLKANGRISHKGFYMLRWWKKNKTTPINGHILTWIALPAVKGTSRITLAEFCRQFDKGVYIIRVSKHVIALVDGIVYDTFETRPDKCVYGYWKINKE